MSGRNTMGLRVVDIGRQRLEEAAEVLALAFEGDPLMGHFFPVPAGDLHDKLKALFRFSCEVRLQLDWPLLGGEKDGQLLGVMGVTEPEHKEWPESLVEYYEMTTEAIGPTAATRLDSMSRVVDERRPYEPHYFLGVIGTHPKARGMGCARVLMNTIHSFSEAHPTSIGVALDTENPNNVAFYNHFGYHVLAEETVEGMTLWVMFRPNQS